MANSAHSATVAEPRRPKKASKAAGTARETTPASGVTFLRIVGFFSSLRLTVVCLTLGMLLVFAGTLAQVDLGLYKAQSEFFRSFFVYWGPEGPGWKISFFPGGYLGPSGPGWKIPIFPGGYLVGGVLMINLVTAHFTRFKLTRKKIGIWMTHVGIILLLLGQFLTDMLSRESTVHLRNGQSTDYSVTERESELAVIDTTDADSDKVVAIPQGVLHHEGTVRHPELPFSVQVKKFLQNSAVEKLSPDAPAPATQGVGSRVAIQELPRVTEMEKRDVPSAVVEINTPQGPLGTWLVSEFIEAPQTFTYNHRSYALLMRPRRFYEPYTIQLLNFQHDSYAGTDIPRNFSSRVQVERPDTGEKREVLIYMNSPLRYAGQTYYQAGFDPDDGGTILQVVHNPSWLTPYFACILVGAGLLVQFLTHLFGFALKWRTA